jgi:hypothetical protein
MPTAFTSPTRPTPTSGDHRFLLTRLQRDWERLCVSRTALSAARDWDLGIESFDTLDELVVLLGGRVRGVRGAHDDDRVLGRLVHIARSDELAARVLLQRLLPGLATMTRRHSWSFSEELDGFADVLTHAWTVVRSYDIDRHPTYVASNLIRRVEYHAYRKPHRRRMVCVPVDSSLLDVEPAVGGLGDPADPRHDDPAGELDEVLSLAAAAGLSADDVELARRLGRGESTVAIAREWRVTDRTIRNRRAAMLERLRAAVAIALGDPLAAAA